MTPVSSASARLEPLAVAGPSAEGAAVITVALATMLAPLNSEFPIRPDIAPSSELVALGAFKEENIPLDALGRHQAEAARIFEEVGWR